MSVTKLPSGRWRAQVYDRATGKNRSVGTFSTKREAKAAREDARKRLASTHGATTVVEFRERWLSDPLFRRPKESTMRHLTERTRAFTAQYGPIRLSDVDDQIVSTWLAGGRNVNTVPALRAMWNDAASAKAGRLASRNPWAGLGLHKRPGNRVNKPPTEDVVWGLIHAAHRVSCPSFARWLQVAAFTGMRPGELDALRWSALDYETEEIHVAEQFSTGARGFTSPKNGQPRNAPMTLHAKEALLAAPRDHPDFCFVGLRGDHWTAQARAYHWKAVRAAADYSGTLYLATRHFFGWYAINALLLTPEDVAIALGHTDGGYLVRTLYGHRDEAAALERVRAAYRNANVRPLRAVREDSA